MLQAHTYMEVSSRATQEAKAEEAQDAYMDVRLAGMQEVERLRRQSRGGRVMQDDYRDIGGRESQEHFLEQLPSDLSPFI